MVCQISTFGSEIYITITIIIIIIDHCNPPVLISNYEWLYWQGLKPIALFSYLLHGGGAESAPLTILLITVFRLYYMIFHYLTFFIMGLHNCWRKMNLKFFRGENSCLQKNVMSKKNSGSKNNFGSENIFWSQSLGHCVSKLSSIKGWLPWQVVFHQR